MNRSTKSIIILAAFPPPYFGSAKNSALLADMIEARNVPVKRNNTAVGIFPHARTSRYHIRRIGANIRAFFSIVRFASNSRAVYMVPDGGLGLYYFIFHYMAALLLSEKIVLHHRTSKYVEKHMVLMSLISRLGRGRVFHVFLSENMAAVFQHKYGPVYYMVCTNAYFVDEALSTPFTNDHLKCLNIGHLSNLCYDKGFFFVADLFERLTDKGKNIKLFLAGPIIEKSVKQRIDEMKERFPGQIIYHGPIYDKKKALFYQRLDLFVFPSRHSQEAQPNVIYEALAAGVPVISTPRGCIPEMLYGEQGFVSPDEEDFVDFALNCIENYMRWDTQTRQLRRQAIRNHMRRCCNVSKRQYAALLSLLIGNKDEKCFT